MDFSAFVNYNLETFMSRLYIKLTDHNGKKYLCDSVEVSRKHCKGCKTLEVFKVFTVFTVTLNSVEGSGSRRDW